jgi:putative ABC transport system permease protein
MLGVVIGVAAIVALTSIVDGASQGINRSLATLGTNQLNISAFGPNALTEQDARALAELDGVSVMFMQSQNEGTIATADARVEARLVGVSKDYFEAVKPVLAMGSYLSSNPAALNSRDVVFGADAANDLGLTSDMLGKSVKLNGKRHPVN